MKKGFRILKISLREHYLFHSLDVNLCDGKDLDKKIEKNDNEPYSSILIGLNGTGKSNLLRVVVDIFREIYDFKLNQKRLAHISGFFHIIYSLDGDTYEFKNVINIKEDLNGEKKTNYYSLKNGKEVKLQDLPLPGAILVNSMMLTDKYLVLGKNTKFDIYTYLGVRRTSSIAGTRTYVRKTVEHVVSSLDRKNFLKELGHILSFLNLQKSCVISYDVKLRKEIFEQSINLNTIKNYYEKYGKEYKAKPDSEKSYAWLGYQYYEKIKNDKELMDEIVMFCIDIADKMESKKKHSPARCIKYDIFDSNTFKKDYEMIKHLSGLDLLSFPNIIFQKDDDKFDFEESSSGEANFISSVLGILSSVKNNSIILIDEPEISLHPNWQMQYVSLLKEMLRHCADSHILIATHSHFLVSDLRNDSSAVISMGYTLKDVVNKFDEVDRKKFYSGDLLSTDTYGWSAEQVLLDVFQVPTTRNYYVAEKIGEILEMIAQPERNDDEIRVKVRELKEKKILNLSDEDPLKSVITKLIEKYG